MLFYTARDMRSEMIGYVLICTYVMIFCFSQSCATMHDNGLWTQRQMYYPSFAAH